ncbi:MAG TPA: hypothetical protein VGC42_03735, partial [Kofleriaceae bacterium]
QKRAYRNLLTLARAHDGRILTACSQFTVASLLALSLGSSVDHDPRFEAYAKGVAGTGLTRIEAPAATAAEADRWGQALIKLATSARLTAEVVGKVIPQRPSARALKRLVDDAAVDAFVAYVNGVDGVVLHADNGSEVSNFCEFLAEGGSVARYAALRPELRHVHRYTVTCLDALLVHRARGRIASPLTVVLQTALDHNGVTYRNAHVTNLVLRPNRTTIIVESQGSLGGFAAAAEAIAARHKTDGKVDEMLITGHGESQSMGLAATKPTGAYDPATEDLSLKPIGIRLIEALRDHDTSRPAFRAVLQGCPGVTDTSALPEGVRPAFTRLCTAARENPTVLSKLEAALAGLAEVPANTLTGETQGFIDRIMAIMRDDAATSRIVLHACLTASNKVLIDVDGTAPVAQQQAAIKAAIAKDPSLVTKVKERIPRKYLLDVAEVWGKKGVSVLGANASVYGRTTELHDPGTGRITLSNPGDDRLTATNKRDYARHGIEPEGALRAALEAWADDKDATITALGQRVVAAPSTDWNERVIRALYARVVANPNNGALLLELERASGALANLTRADDASVAEVRAKVPAAHAHAIYNGLTGAAAWADIQYWYTRVVLYQAWMATDAGKCADLLATLTAGGAAGLTTQMLAKYLDYAGLAPHLAAMLPVPGDVGAIRRGPTLLALACVAKQGAAAPAAALGYLRGVLNLREVDGRQFPDEAHVNTLLRGATTSSILTALGRGVVEAPVVAEARITRHNLSAAHAGRNDTTVTSVSLRGRIRGAATPVYARPGGDEAAQLDDATAVFIHGKVGDEWYAIERGQTTAFVRQDRVTLA